MECKYSLYLRITNCTMRLFILCLIVFCSFSSMGQNADIELLRKVNGSRNSSMDPSMKLLSHSEYIIGVALPVSVCVASWAKRDATLLQKGVNMSLAMILNTGSTFLLKRIINRDRPQLVYPDINAFENEKHYSFPSGHTSNAFVAATSLSLNFKKWYVVLPSFAWASAVGYSRMYLGAHYPSDVLAGAILGAGSAFVTFKANQYLKKYYLKKHVEMSF